MSSNMDRLKEENERLTKDNVELRRRETFARTVAEDRVGRPLRYELERLKTWVNDLQSGMYISCVYCGHRYGPSDEVPVSMADVLKEHIEKCPEHPMSKLRARLDGAQKAWGVLGKDGKFTHVVTGEYSGFEIERDVPVLILREEEI